MSSASIAWRRILSSRSRTVSNEILVVNRRRIHREGSSLLVGPQPIHQLRQKNHRRYHVSTMVFDDGETKELSPKEKKKLLKAKAKAAMAAKEASEAKDEETESPPGDTKPTTTLKETVAAQEKSTSTENEKEGNSSSSSSSDDEEKPKTSSGNQDEGGDAAAAPSKDSKAETSPPTEAKEYSYDELTADAAKHKAGLDDPTRPSWQNPLHHNNPDMQKCFPEDFDSPEEFEKAVLPAPPLDPGDGSVVAPPYMHELVDEVVHLTMLEYNELINKIADHYGFHESDLAPDDAGGDDGGDDDDGTGGAPAEEKTAFDIKLVSFDAKAKIKIIKEVRSIVTGLGLKEAKTMVEGAPVILQKGMNKEDAEQVKAKLEELGAVIEVD